LGFDNRFYLCRYYLASISVLGLFTSPMVEYQLRRWVFGWSNNDPTDFAGSRAPATDCTFQTYTYCDDHTFAIPHTHSDDHTFANRSAPLSIAP
jgi:hypothetical protein